MGRVLTAIASSKVSMIWMLQACIMDWHAHLKYSSGTDQVFMEAAQWVSYLVAKIGISRLVGRKIDDRNHVSEADQLGHHQLRGAA